MPKPTEKAVLRVRGKVFDEWKSVEVNCVLLEAYNVFRFTCAEPLPFAKNWHDAQFRPGDPVEIFLAGQLAMTGYITQRQAAYDKDDHGVMLIGKTRTFDLTCTSVVSETGSFDNTPWAAIARSVISPFGIGLATIGNIPSTPIQDAHVHPGESPWQFLDRLSRNQGIMLGSDEKGNLVAVGQHDVFALDELIEGKNILRANCIIDDDMAKTDIRVKGQTRGSDDAFGSAVSEIAGMALGDSSRWRPYIVQMEQPGGMADAIRRAEFEARWGGTTHIDCNITVVGWLRAGQALWKPGQYVHVSSPMLMLTQDLGIQSVTFTQNNDSGTLTTLGLIDPHRMNGGRVDIRTSGK